jgi:hypothetical protein
MKKNDKKKVLRSVAAKDAVFAYISVCCNIVAEKPACAVAVGHRVGEYLGAKPEGEATLGGWRCPQCRKPCKVSRMKNPLREPQQEAVNA